MRRRLAAASNITAQNSPGEFLRCGAGSAESLHLRMIRKLIVQLMPAGS